MISVTYMATNTHSTMHPGVTVWLQGIDRSGNNLSGVQRVCLAKNQGEGILTLCSAIQHGHCTKINEHALLPLQGSGKEAGVPLVKEDKVVVHIGVCEGQ